MTRLSGLSANPGGAGANRERRNRRGGHDGERGGSTQRSSCFFDVHPALGLVKRNLVSTMFEISVSSSTPGSLTRLRSLVASAPRLVLVGLLAFLAALGAATDASATAREGDSPSAYDVRFEHLPDQMQAGERTEVTVIATRNGERVKTPVHLFADHGEFENGGRFREDWAVTGSDGQVTITYRAPDDNQVESDRVRAKIPATPSGHVDTSAKIQLQETIKAALVDVGGGDRIEPGESLEVTVRAKKNGRGIPGVRLKLLLDPASMSDGWTKGQGTLEDRIVTTGSTGKATTTYTAPSTVTHDVLAIRDASGGREVLHRFDDVADAQGISVEKHPAADVSLEWPDDFPQPGETIRMKMKVVAGGSPLANVPVKLHLEEPTSGDPPQLGELEKRRVVTDAQGRATVTYHAPDMRTTVGMVVNVQSEGGGGVYHEIPVRP